MNPLVMRTVALVLFLLPPAITLNAAETVLLEEIIVRGEKESPRDAILTMREVQESYTKDIGEALNRVSGVANVRKGAIANDIVLRGFQRDNINVLVDGVRIHGACPARMDPPTFHYDFAEIEEIRIVKGPYDIEHPGSLGGLVETLTKETNQDVDSSASLTYGSYNSLNASATVSYGGEKFDGLGGYAFKRSDVPKSGEGRYITDIYAASNPNRYRQPDFDGLSYKINSIWFKVGFNPDSGGRSEMSYSYQNAEDVLYPYLKMDAEFDRTHRLNWTYNKEQLGAGFQDLKLQVYWNQVRHVMTDSLRMSSSPTPLVTRSYMMRSDATTEMLGAKVLVARGLGSGTWKTGVDYYRRTWDTLNERAKFTPAAPYTPWHMLPAVQTDNYGLFSGYELPVTPKLALTGGVRWDFTRTEAQKANNATAISDAESFNGFSANFQVTWKPASGFEIFSGLGRSVRPPDPEELYINVPAAPPSVTWIGNPALDPVTNHQMDLGFKFSSNRYYLSVSVYYSHVTDYINFFSPSATLKSYQNIDAEIKGLEITSQISLPLNFFVSGSLALTEGYNLDGNRPLSEMPPLNLLISARYDTGRWLLEVTGTISGKQSRVDKTLGETSADGWNTLDLKTGLQFRQWRFYAGVNNLLDETYVTHLSYQRDPFASVPPVKVPENGRNIYATVVWEY